MASYRKQTPEAWHAKVLADEIEELTAAVRALEFNQGFLEGENVNGLAVRACEETPGETA